MSKTWYPVIDYSLCSHCGACYNKCTHGVYELKEQRPVVINPDECIHGCHGCGHLCSEKAISYVGEVEDSQTCGCNCSCGS